MALDGIGANGVNAVKTTTVESKAEQKEAKETKNSVFEGTAKEAPEAKNAPEAKMMEELNNLKPSNFKEFFKASSTPSKVAGVVGATGFAAAAVVGGVAGANPLGVVFEYAKERHNQKKDIATLQDGVAGKTVYLSKKDYKKAVKNPDYDGNAVLIRSNRFKKYVVENSDALGVGEVKTSDKKEKV
jgi:hypothetical protein